MSTIELVDPELRDALALWPQVPLTAETLTRRRADALALLSSVPTPDLPDIATGEIHVESAFGAKPIRVLTYRPVRSNDPLPVIVHIHGGGFVMGTPEMKDVENRLFASELKCAIYSVDYRLAPEAPHPAPLAAPQFTGSSRSAARQAEITQVFQRFEGRRMSDTSHLSDTVGGPVIAASPR